MGKLYIIFYILPPKQLQLHNFSNFEAIENNIEK